MTTRFIGDVHGKYRPYKRLIADCKNSIQVGDMGVGFPIIGLTPQATTPRERALRSRSWLERKPDDWVSKKGDPPMGGNDSYRGRGSRRVFLVFCALFIAPIAWGASGDEIVSGSSPKLKTELVRARSALTEFVAVLNETEYVKGNIDPHELVIIFMKREFLKAISNRRKYLAGGDDKLVVFKDKGISRRRGQRAMHLLLMPLHANSFYDGSATAGVLKLPNQLHPISINIGPVFPQNLQPQVRNVHIRSLSGNVGIGRLLGSAGGKIGSVGGGCGGLRSAMGGVPEFIGGPSQGMGEPRQSYGRESKDRTLVGIKTLHKLERYRYRQKVFSALLFVGAIALIAYFAMKRNV